LKTKYPNQIDDLHVDQLEALISLENIIGTNPNGAYSTVNDRLNNLDEQLKSLNILLSKDYLQYLNLSTILSLNNHTDGYDIILSEGDALTGVGGIVNIYGDTTITGYLSVTKNIDLNNNNIKNLPLPIYPDEAANKLYIDNQISAQSNKFNNLITSIINKDNNSIQYTKGISQCFPEPKANQYLKRTKDNSAWEFKEIDLETIYNKIESINKSINFVSKIMTHGQDFIVNIGDAIKGEDGFVNIDSEVIIHKGLTINGTLDAQYHNLSNLLDPTLPHHAVTKKYLDDRIPKHVIISDNLYNNVDVYYHDKLFNCNILNLNITLSDNIIISGIKFPEKPVRFNLINCNDIFNIILKHNDCSVFGNSFKLANCDDLVIPPNGCCELIYDFDQSFWRVISTNFNN